MVVISDSIADPNTTLSAVVAEVFCEAADILEKADDFDVAVHDLIKKYMTEHQRIIFNGDGYSDAWVEEAARRGLPNIRSMVESSCALTTEKAIKLFEKFHIFTKVELESREEVLYETYSKCINIEALTMIDMAKKQILPAVIKYTKSLADTVIAVKEAGADASVQTELLNDISAKLVEAKKALSTLEDRVAASSKIATQKELAFFFKDEVVVAMEALRTPVDELEMLVDKEVWPIPTYGDLIFEV
ncbi:MAG: glutamine synthetase type III, partial [Acetatifactor sp.]|nr:glutamine synthetase type III [Acetatifactor sp.]